MIHVKGLDLRHFKAAKADLNFKVQWQILSSIKNKKQIRIQEDMPEMAFLNYVLLIFRNLRHLIKKIGFC